MNATEYKDMEALQDELILLRASVEELGRRLGVELPPQPDCGREGASS